MIYKVKHYFASCKIFKIKFSQEAYKLRQSVLFLRKKPFQQSRIMVKLPRAKGDLSFCQFCFHFLFNFDLTLL